MEKASLPSQKEGKRTSRYPGQESSEQRTQQIQKLSDGHGTGKAKNSKETDVAAWDE